MKEVFINEQVNIVCKNYKIDEDTVRKYTIENVEKNSDLLSLLKNKDSLAEIYKTGVYKKFIKKLKKEIYYKLRTYQKDNTSIEDSHISSKERKPHLKELVNELDGVFSSSLSIIDLGGGVFPVTFPFEKYKNVQSYVWLDKDKKSFEKLSAFKNENNLTQLYLVNKNISDVTWIELLKINNDKQYDLALMLKLIPVVKRQERHLLDFISKVPARYIFISGSKESLVKKESIEYRENQDILKFITSTNREIVSRIDIENEFGYLIC